MLRGWSDDPAVRRERDRDRARLASKVHTVGPFQPRGAAVLRLGLIVREYWERRVAWRARVFPARTMPAHTIPMLRSSAGMSLTRRWTRREAPPTARSSPMSP